MAAAKKKENVATKAKSAEVNAPSSESSSINIDANTAKLLAGASYIFPIIGLVLYFLFKKGENDFARYHSLQSVLLGVIFFAVSFVGMMVAGIVMLVVGIIPILGAILGLFIGLGVFALSGLLCLVYLAIAIFCLMKVLKDEKFKLPIIGKFAEQYS